MYMNIYTYIYIYIYIYTRILRALRARIGSHHQGERRPSFLYRLNLSHLPVCRFQVWFAFQRWLCSRSLRASEEPSEPPGAAGAASPEPEDTPGISQEGWRRAREGPGGPRAA